MPNQTAPHSIACRCDECLSLIHSYHDALVSDCPCCFPEVYTTPQEPIIDTMKCYACLPNVGIERELTGRTRTVNRADPTESYELTCGHYAI